MACVKSNPIIFFPKRGDNFTCYALLSVFCGVEYIIFFLNFFYLLIFSSKDGLEGSVIWLQFCVLMVMLFHEYQKLLFWFWSTIEKLDDELIVNKK